MKTLAGFRGNRILVAVAILLGTATLSSLPRPIHAAADCSAGRSMSVVAHPDDDLLFQSPDVLRDVRAGKCLESVYLTAGDAGQSTAYAARRQAGIKAAYAEMAGQPDSWTRVEMQSYGHLSELDTLRSDPKISLRFFFLPDGNPLGSGFAADHFASLEKLWNGDIATIETIDGSDRYTRAGLIEELTRVMDDDQPDLIRTLNFTGQFGADYQTHSPSWDHSDHLAAGRFSLAADQTYESVSGTHMITGYIGSGPGDDLNLSGVDLSAKKSAFYAYGQFDAATRCTQDADCAMSGSQYPRLLRRQHVAEKESWNSPKPVEQPALSLSKEPDTAASETQPQAAKQVVVQAVANDRPVQQPPPDPNLRSTAGEGSQQPLSTANSPPSADSNEGYLQHVWATMR